MRGLLMFAHNNGLFDYGKMAYAAAKAAKHHLRVPVSLITDYETWESLAERFHGVRSTFDDVKMVTTDGYNKRHFDMQDGTQKKAKYHNTSRLHAYDLSPYEETLVLDTDVLVQDNSLASVWGSHAPVRMNKEVSELVKHMHGDGNTTQSLSDKSPPIFWATICYFRKCPQAKQFFGLAEFVMDNYEYYSVLYGFPSTLRRVDFAYTVASHIMSGYVEGRSIVDTLPIPDTVFAWNKDILVDVKRGQATFLAHVHGSATFPVTVHRTVHCMNKDSMLEQADKVIECYA